MMTQRNRIPGNFLRFSIAIIVLGIANTDSVMGQAVDESDQSHFVGHWLGTLDTGRGKLRLKLVVEKKNGGIRGAIFSVDQGNAEIKLDRVQAEGLELQFSSKRVGMTFAGKLSENKDAIAGTLTQLGAKFDMKFGRVSKDRKPDKHLETWQGILDAGNRKFEFQLRVFESADGKKVAKLDSFSESLFDLPVEYQSDDDQITIRLDFSGAVYSAKLSNDKNQMKGLWKQRGVELDLSLVKVPLNQTRDPKANRPQTPKGPFPYEVREVKFDNRVAGITLAGTLTIPKGEGPFPAAILISGSGPQDRDSTIAGHKPFWVIADALTRRGIAVLRYDERGVGKSTGDLSQATSHDLSLDVESAMKYLSGVKKVDRRKIGLIGHSEGGYVAPMIAARNRDVSFIVSMAGPGVPGRQIVLSQTRLILEASGADPKMVEMTTQFSQGLFKQLEQSRGSNDIMQKMRQQFQQQLKGIPDSLKKQMEQSGGEASSLAQMTSPWFQFFAHHDPRADWRKVKCPVLAINGTLDLQVDPELNLPEIEKALMQAKNRDVTIKRLKGLNHLFQTTETGKIEEYAQLEETFNADALKLIVDWVVQKMR